MTDQPRPPLWWVMHDAHMAAPDDTRLEGAAQIRALADWLVPEISVHPFPANLSAHEYHLQRYQHRLRQLLLAEADRAEAGE